jgi:hypothetical protein
MPVSTIPAFLRQPQITGIVRSMDVPVNYMFPRWFPMEDVDADEFESLIMVDQADLAPFVAIDAETPRMPDDIFGSYKWQVAYIRYKKAFKESDLRIFFEPGVNDPNTLTAANARAAERKIRRYVDALSLAVEARKEWMFAGAIAGSLAYNDEHVQYSVTFDGAYMGASRRKTPGTLWSAANPTIITNLSQWVEEISDETGIDEWVLMTSPKVLGLMSRSADVREAWAASSLNRSQIPDSLNPVMPGSIGLAIEPLGIVDVVKYTAKYTTRTESAGSVTRTKTRFINDNDLFLLPANERLGRIATAPAQPNNWRPGKFGWSKESMDPWVVEVGAGEYAWIDFPPTNHNKVLQARVA